VEVVSSFYYPVAREVDQIHGQVILPPGYRLYKLLPGVKVKLTRGISNPKWSSSLDLSSSRNIAKLLIGIIQLLFACATLYRSRGSQLEKYGYAAFGLTVIPYAAMTLVNFLAGFVTPEFTHLFVVRSKYLEEAKGKGGFFDGTFGEPDEDQEEYQTRIDETSHVHSLSVSAIGRFKYRRLTRVEYLCQCLASGLVVVAFVVPYLITLGLTEFKPQESTLAQRAWTMSWLVADQFTGVTWAISVRIVAIFYTRGHDAIPRIVYTVVCAVFCGSIAAAIGGYVTIAKMMQEFGNCMNI